jgi:5,5'-dehydrodivanillate O-demethylase
MRIPCYPVREYLGLIFAYFGPGEPPPLNRFPKFEDPKCIVDAVRFDRICNYYGNIENSLDNVHVRFVHSRHRDSVRDHAATGDPVIKVEESDWGVRRYAGYPNGTESVFFFGMPNINYIIGQVVDRDVKRVESLIFKVPVDDDRHLHFEARLMPYSGERGKEWLETRRAQRAKEALDRLDLVRAVLGGRLRLDDIDPGRRRSGPIRPRRDSRPHPGTSGAERYRSRVSQKTLGERAARLGGRPAAKAVGLPPGHGAGLSRRRGGRRESYTAVRCVGP